MSMLAERKVKQKWSLNPRGKNWAEDSNKFGQKILERMGWSKGKGLGAKEDGIKEHIKISYKNDIKGMGYKENAEQWTVHEDNFKALLDSLTSNNNVNGNITNVEKEKRSSLEQKSQSSRVRVHYKKFTRGKDLSRYSEKDLANIFGRKTLKPEEKKFQTANSNKDCEKETEEHETNNNSGGNFLKNSGSMLDYFKTKSPNFGKFKPKNGFIVGQNGVLQSVPKLENESEDEIKPRLGFGFSDTSLDETQDAKLTSANNFFNFSKEKTDMNGCENPYEIKRKPKKRKSLKHMFEVDNPSFNEGVSFQINNDRFDEMEIQSPVKVEVKKKSKKQKSCKRNIDVDNPTFNADTSCQSEIDNTMYEVKRNSKNSVVEEDETSSNSAKYQATQKSKKQLFLEQDFRIDNPTFNGDLVLQDPVVNILHEVKRNPKKQKDKSGFEKSKTLSLTTSEIKRKRKFLKEDLEIDNPTFNGNISFEKEIDNTSNEVKRISKNEIGNQISNSFEVKRKTKKHKKLNQNFEVLNPAFNSDISFQDEVDNTSCEVIQKAKNVVDTASFEEIEISTASNCSEFEVKRKFKKQKLFKQEFELNNPAFNGDVSLQNEENYSDVSNQKYEVCRKEKKQKKNRNKISEVDNPAFDEGLEDSSSSRNLTDENFEIPRKKKKLSEIPEELTRESEEVTCNLMLNVCSTPILKTPSSSNANPNKPKRRKSVRFSAVNEEHIIPNLDDLKNLNEERQELFAINEKVMDPKSNLFSKKIDGLQAQVENDINEAKMLGYIGDTTSLNIGENEKLRNGETKLKLKYAHFHKKTSFYSQNIGKSLAKSSYKHLIRGDIILGFKDSNLHEINGYCNKENSS